MPQKLLSEAMSQSASSRPLATPRPLGDALAPAYPPPFCPALRRPYPCPWPLLGNRCIVGVDQIWIRWPHVVPLYLLEESPVTIPTSYHVVFDGSPNRTRNNRSSIWLVALAVVALLLLSTACVSSGFIDATWDLSLKPVHAVWTTQSAN